MAKVFITPQSKPSHAETVKLTLIVASWDFTRLLLVAHVWVKPAAVHSRNELAFYRRQCCIIAGLVMDAPDLRFGAIEGWENPDNDAELLTELKAGYAASDFIHEESF